MKTLFKNRIVPAATALVLALSAQANRYANPGSGQAYNLYSGDTLEITQSTYHGSINTFNTGAVIIVDNGAILQPDNINSPAGKILNYGQIRMNGMYLQAGAAIMNYGQIDLNGNMDFYNGSSQSTLFNNLGATININGGFSMNNTVFTNNATMNLTGSFAMYLASSVVTNNGKIVMGGNFNMSAGALTNNNIIRMVDFNGWGGTVSNAGQMNPRGNATFSNGGSYSNNCLMNTGQGFTAYSAFTNQGLLWVGTTNSDADQFYNGGNFTGTAGSFVRAYKMINYSNISGSASFYIYGSSYTSGIVGTSGTTSDSIRIYDASPTGSNIFDTQYGTIYNNVKFQNLTLVDTTAVNYSGCSAIYKNQAASTTLPVKFTAFDVKLVNDATAISWSAAYEGGMRFDVERSTDNKNFKSISSLMADAVASYQVQDKNIAGLSGVVYYRIKGSAIDGDVKYTEVRMVRLGTQDAGLSVYPNPLASSSVLQFNASKAGQGNVRISNPAGQQISSKTISISNGKNTLNLEGVSNMKAGIYLVELMMDNHVIGTVKVIRN